MPTPYRHTPIAGSRSIRVLELQPAPNVFASIRCKLRAFSLDNYPQWEATYTALSYTWDGQEPSCEIQCDGCVMLITPNCDAAIRHLRSATEIQVLWIDSICIDQSEEAVVERNGQVALMGEIYMSAAKVVIWLGQGNERVEAAIREVAEFLQIAKSGDVGGRGGINHANRRATQAALRDRLKRISSTVTHASEDPFGPLFECSWFYRVWTIQESTLPSSDRVTLRYGILEIPWLAITVVVDLLYNASYKWGRWQEAMTLQNQIVIWLICQRIEGARTVMDDNPEKPENDPLMRTILHNIRTKQASNPKDRIIGLYGLLKELHIPFPSPDYSLSVEEIFREATIASINFDKKLHLLYYAPSDRRRDGLASWVPDWAESGFDQSDMRHAVFGRERERKSHRSTVFVQRVIRWMSGKQGLFKGNFAASGPATPTWRFSQDHAALILRGKIVDTVIHKSEALPDTRSFIKDNQDLQGEPGEPGEHVLVQMIRLNHAVSITMKSWVEMSRSADYPTGEPSKEALQRTLVYDQPANNADAIRHNAFNDWYDNMCLDDMDEVVKRSRDTSLSRTEESTSDPMFIWRRFGTNRFHCLAHLFSSRKCFFYTGNYYFGTAPDPLPVSMMPGDEIAIIRGLEMPLLLRPVENGYKLITHVYVHGMMYGEMWPQDEGCLEDIILR